MRISFSILPPLDGYRLRFKYLDLILNPGLTVAIRWYKEVLKCYNLDGVRRDVFRMLK